jgi:3-oxoacyl-[acyl-carrier protein] reductase
MNIVITGASRGIGYRTALGFTARANRVFALSRNREGLDRLVNESNGKVEGIVCDISDEASVKNAVSEISNKVSSIEILINNAGLLVNKSIENLSVSDWKNVYGVNVFGVFNLTKELLSLLRKGELSAFSGVHSHVVNISSMGGVQGSMKFAGLSAYSSSKGALITMTECFSQELQEEGIRVNCVALGSVETEMFAQAFPGIKAGAQVKGISQWIVDFSSTGWRFFNGKTLPASTMTP